MPLEITTPYRSDIRCLYTVGDYYTLHVLNPISVHSARLRSQSDPTNDVCNGNIGCYVFKRPEDEHIMVETCSRTLYNIIIKLVFMVINI
jgi:hypothetical protein